LRASTRLAVGTEVVDEAEKICVELAKLHPRATFFAAKLVFQKEKWYQRLLHHETGFTIQRRLQWLGLSMVVLPVRVWN